MITMLQGVVFQLVSICVLVRCFNGDLCTSSYRSFPWQPDLMSHRQDLYCDSFCQKYDYPYQTEGFLKDVDSCCLCRSCTNFTKNIRDLYLEYVSVSGKSLVTSDMVFDPSKFYQIVHTWAEMSEIPSNLCFWDIDGRIDSIILNENINLTDFWNNIVTINFKGNAIRQLVNLNCLSRLDTLKLGYNRIAYISNNSFNMLTYLRNLDLSNNRIKTMDPGVFYAPGLHILNADISDNDLKQIGVTNTFLPSPFCEIDFSHNNITDITNEGFKLNKSHQYGPGVLNLEHSAIDVFPDWKDLLGLDSLAQWGKLLNWGFKLQGIKLNCDCHLEPFLNLFEDVRHILWRDSYNVTCGSPPQLAGQSAFFVDPEKLVCIIDQKSGCPRGCTCIDSPRRNRLYVDCASSHLTALPDVVPLSKLTDYISVNVSHNKIAFIDSRTYLNRVVHLDLSSNLLEDIDSKVANILDKATLDLSNNIKLRAIPQVFQFRNVCLTKMEHVVLDCNCESLWIETWLQTKVSGVCGRRRDVFKCDVPAKGQISGIDFKRSMVECGQDETVFHVVILVIATLVLILLVIGALVYKFRYELTVIWTRIRQTSLELHVDLFKYDVFISLNEEDDKLRLWVKDKLLHVLTLNGYRVFFPLRDLQYGGERDGEIAKVIKQSRTFIAVLSESYLVNPKDSPNGRSWTENEWKYGWTCFLDNRDHTVLIVNYDYISPSAVKHQQIKAFLRVGHTVNFDNQDMQIIYDIRRKIGAPSPDRIMYTRMDSNRKIRFLPQTLKPTLNKYIEGPPIKFVRQSGINRRTCTCVYSQEKASMGSINCSCLSETPFTIQYPAGTSLVSKAKPSKSTKFVYPYHLQVEKDRLDNELPAPVFAKLRMDPSKPSVSSIASSIQALDNESISAVET